MSENERGKAPGGAKLFIPMRGYEDYDHPFDSYRQQVVYPHEGL